MRLEGYGIYSNGTYLGDSGLNGGGAEPLLLDEYPNAAAAYSVRRLSSSYTGALMEVRRSSDNTTQNIGFDSNGDLDTVSLLSFVGVGDGFVRTWYDQSGNNLDLIQNTSSNQSQIVSSGTINLVNNKPAILFNGTSNYYQVSYAAQINFSVFNVSKFTNLPTSNEVYLSFSDGTNLNRYELRADGSNFECFIREVASVSQTITTQNVNQNLFSSIYLNGSNNSWLNNVNYINNLSTGIPNPNFDRLNVGNLDSSGFFFYFDGSHQEIISYNSDQSSNRTGIESNINSYFSIYSPPGGIGTWAIGTTFVIQ